MLEYLGCPALAGIDLGLYTKAPEWSRLPRTRGDRPMILTTVRDILTAAPHSRG